MWTQCFHCVFNEMKTQTFENAFVWTRPQAPVSHLLSIVTAMLGNPWSLNTILVRNHCSMRVNSAKTRKGLWKILRFGQWLSYSGNSSITTVLLCIKKASSKSLQQKATILVSYWLPDVINTNTRSWRDRHATETLPHSLPIQVCCKIEIAYSSR